MTTTSRLEGHPASLTAYVIHGLVSAKNYISRGCELTENILATTEGLSSAMNQATFGCLALYKIASKTVGNEKITQITGMLGPILGTGAIAINLLQLTHRNNVLLQENAQLRAQLGNPTRLAENTLAKAKELSDAMNRAAITSFATSGIASQLLGEGRITYITGLLGAILAASAFASRLFQETHRNNQLLEENTQLRTLQEQMTMPSTIPYEQESRR